MTRITDINDLTNPNLYLYSGVVMSRATYFWVDSYFQQDPLHLSGKDFDIFVKTFMPDFTAKFNYDYIIEISNAHKMHYASRKLKSELHHVFTVALLHSLVYGCDHESDVMDCIDFNVNDSFEVDAFNDALKDGSIKTIFDSLSEMRVLIERTNDDYHNRLNERNWIFEESTIIRGINYIGKSDIELIADSIRLEFEHHFEKTTRYMQDMNLNKVFPVLLPDLAKAFSDDLNVLFSKGGSLTYAEFCDFVVKYGLHESKIANCD